MKIFVQQIPLSTNALLFNLRTFINWKKILIWSQLLLRVLDVFAEARKKSLKQSAVVEVIVITGLEVGIL